MKNVFPEVFWLYRTEVPVFPNISIDAVTTIVRPIMRTFNPVLRELREELQWPLADDRMG